MNSDSHRLLKIQVLAGTAKVRLTLDGICEMSPDEASGLAFRLVKAADQARASLKQPPQQEPRIKD